MPFKSLVDKKKFILINPAGIRDDKGNTYWTAENCKVPKPIKLLHILGNLDTVIRYDESSDWHPSALAFSLQWVKINKCDLNFVAGNLASRPRSNKRITTKSGITVEIKAKYLYGQYLAVAILS